MSDTDGEKIPSTMFGPKRKNKGTGRGIVLPVVTIKT
jgi:hypothetical protein